MISFSSDKQDNPLSTGVACWLSWAAVSRKNSMRKVAGSGCEGDLRSSQFPTDMSTVVASA